MNFTYKVEMKKGTEIVKVFFILNEKINNFIKDIVRTLIGTYEALSRKKEIDLNVNTHKLF
jgi:hypothetical protein